MYITKIHNKTGIKRLILLYRKTVIITIIFNNSYKELNGLNRIHITSNIRNNKLTVVSYSLYGTINRIFMSNVHTLLTHQLISQYCS
jgi:hypothetical protein